MMKAIITIFFVCCMALGLTAQITITSADMPNSGDTIRYSEANLDTATLALYEQTGANFTWDFSHLVPNNQGLEEYQSAMQTPYAFFFLGSGAYGLKVIDTLNLGGQGSITNVYDFYKNSNTAFEAEGRGLTFQGFPVPAFYADKDEIYQFPLDTADRDSSTFDFTTTVPFLAVLNTNGYRINEVDGWGTIMTPYDTLSCLRVVTDVVSEDSVFVSLLGGGFSFPSHTRTYKWLANGEKFPMLEISGNVALGAFVPTQVRYRDVYRGIQSVSPLAPEADFTADNLFPEAQNDTVTFTPSVLPFINTVSWAISPNTFSYVDGTDNNTFNPRVVFNAPGTYDVTIFVSNPFGNSDTTKVDYITVASVSTSNLTLENELKVFPNPITNHRLNVTFDLKTTEEVQIDLLDVQGRLVKTFRNAQMNAGQYAEELKLSTDLKGVYLLNVRIGNRQQTQQLLIR